MLLLGRIGWVKPLDAGSLACGLINLSASAHEMKLDWTELGFKRAPRCRDAWSRCDLGRPFALRRHLPRHGVVLQRLMT